MKNIVNPQVLMDDKSKDSNGVTKPVGILKTQKSQEQITFIDAEKQNKDTLLISGIRGK
jgi:hypothetical protein